MRSCISFSGWSKTQTKPNEHLLPLQSVSYLYLICIFLLFLCHLCLYCIFPIYYWFLQYLLCFCIVFSVCSLMPSGFFCICYKWFYRYCICYAFALYFPCARLMPSQTRPTGDVLQLAGPGSSLEHN